MAKQLDASWKGWLKENLDRQCDTKELRDILLSHGFAISSIKECMGSQFPAEEAPIDYEALSNVRITHIAQKVPTDKLQLYTLEHFMTPEECTKLLAIVNKQLRPSTISGDANDRYFRTSSTCDLIYTNDSFVEEIDQRIAKTLGISLAYSEPIQAQKYQASQQFKAHTDYFTPHTEEYKQYASRQGNRTWTFMVYLNEGVEGGGTGFVEIDTIFYPTLGMAVIWNNLYPDGTPNPYTLHSGMPVHSGEKNIITKWFREKGTGPMVLE